MGKGWDSPWKTRGLGIDPNLSDSEKFYLWCGLWLTDLYDILPSGGVVKIFSATRTFHRLAQAMERVGFKDINLEAWCYGSGFPKSMNLSKAIDSKLGKSDDRPIVGSRETRSPSNAAGETTKDEWPHARLDEHVAEVTVSARSEAQRFDGWGTALKPAWEPFVTGVKP